MSTSTCKVWTMCDIELGGNNASAPSRGVSEREAYGMYTYAY